MNTWVVRPKNEGGWKYAYDSNSGYASSKDLPWKKLKKPKNLRELSGVITKVGEQRGTEYTEVSFILRKHR